MAMYDTYQSQESEDYEEQLQREKADKRYLASAQHKDAEEIKSLLKQLINNTSQDRR